MITLQLRVALIFGIFLRKSLFTTLSFYLSTNGYHPPLTLFIACLKPYSLIATLILTNLDNWTKMTNKTCVVDGRNVERNAGATCVECGKSTKPVISVECGTKKKSFCSMKCFKNSCNNYIQDRQRYEGFVTELPNKQTINSCWYKQQTRSSCWLSKIFHVLECCIVCSQWMSLY